MPLADFVEGYLSAMRWCGFKATHSFGRDITRSDIDTLDLTELRADLTAFWNTHGAAIEAAPGIPDLRRDNVPVNTSVQAGHALACIQTGRWSTGFLASEWGSRLAGAMKTSADALSTTFIEVENGALVVRRSAVR